MESRCCVRRLATGRGRGRRRREWLVGVALAAPAPMDGVDQLVALGVAPAWRRQGLAGSLLRAMAERQDTVAGRSSHCTRSPSAIHSTRFPGGARFRADRLFRAAGFRPLPVPPGLASADPSSFQDGHFPPGAPSEFLAALELWSAAS